MCVGKCCPLFWELRPCLFLLCKGFVAMNCVHYRVPFSMLKEKLEKKKIQIPGVYIFRSKCIHFLGSFISTLVSCEEIMVKQKVFHLRNKDSVCSFFIMYSFFLHWAWGIEASTFFGFIDFQENLKTSER